MGFLRNTDSNQSLLKTQGVIGEAAAGIDSPAPSRVSQSTAWARWIPELFGPRQFVTMTYRDETSLNSVLRRHGYLVQQVNRKLFGNNWRRHGEGVSYVLGVEPQLRGVLHTHAVWDAAFVPYDLIHTTMKKLGGMAWVEPVTSTCGVGHYVTKYAVKQGQVWIYLSRCNQALRFVWGDSQGGAGRDAFVA